MSILAKLTLAGLPQASAQTSEQRLRQKMVAAMRKWVGGLENESE